MNADTYQQLLKALQKIDKAIVKEHVASCRTKWKGRVQQLHKGAETGGSFDAFAKVLAGRSAVRFLLRTVYARVLEDLELLDPPRIAGQRGVHAFREVAPALGVRAYFEWTFRDLAIDFPALFEVCDDELPIPTEEVCQRVWDLWHLEDGEGSVVYDWSSGDFESRFLGDLYQDLDADVRKRYALLQTPEFVEKYILDHTLSPALEEFDPAELREKGEHFRLIDPTCGSGHFLIGALHRLTDYWKERGLEVWAAMERALESVWGCDINPHAVEIARFRLLLEVMHRTGVRALERLAELQLHLRALDSLIPWEGPRGQAKMFPGSDRLAAYATEQERKDNTSFLGRAFQVVVGNPPYVSPKDARKTADYKRFWPNSAHGQYGLAPPFVERFFVLGTERGAIGAIVSNAFAKKSYGIALVERVLPNWDLTDIVDSSGAYIPGHGTPTLILFGRCSPPVAAEVRCVGGKRGEPAVPEDPAHARVWSSISVSGTRPNDDDPYVTVSVYPREKFAHHPWNTNGGGAPELQTRLEEGSDHQLGSLIGAIGRAGHTGADQAYLFEQPGFASRNGLKQGDVAVVVQGENIRDYSIARNAETVFPYTKDLAVRPERRDDPSLRLLWPLRSRLWERRELGGTHREIGFTWFQFGRFHPERFRGIGLAYSYIGTHNQFALDGGEKLYDQKGPTIKLSQTADVEDHLDLLGLLNSSTLCFWMKQVFFDKGFTGGGAFRGEDWECFFEFDSTKLQKAPIVDADRPARVALARALDQAAQDRIVTLPRSLLKAHWPADALPGLLEHGEERYQALTRRMVALQEELDWLTYVSYGLLQGNASLGPEDVEPLSPGHRPFEILLARHNATCEPDERSTWFRRHGHDETATIPERYTDETRAKMDQRLAIIVDNREVRLIEQPQFKRRWRLVDYATEISEATRSWLLDHLEDLFAADAQLAGQLSEPRPYTLEEVTNAWRDDPRVLAAAAVYLGSENVDLSQLAEALLRDEAIPDNAYRIYSPEGVRKLRMWQDTWRLQDREDAGEEIDIPLPPEFGKGDFRKAHYYKLRGKLNVPRERFIVYAALTPPRYGWNGWRDKDRAMAQVEVFTEAETHPTDPLPQPTADDPRRCGATIGLWESLDDVRRWGDGGDHAELRALAQEACGKQSCPCDVVQSWQKWIGGKLTIQTDQGDATDASATIDERAAMTRVVDRLCPLVLPGSGEKAKPATLKAITAEWEGPAGRIEVVLDDLVASGDLEVKGKAARRKYLPTR